MCFVLPFFVTENDLQEENVIPPGHSHTHTILISRFQVHPAEVNLKELFQTKLEGKPGSEQYCFMSLLMTG